ncbi:Interferon-inducible double stranded RNA-dependent protein kinase activator A [Habropoda laboriosa]|uniref:Interferon-inducible double stranded RNA-dependent protein kinase activator A n=1 Tax=Habropoda laboriosa TaxID=597456 RepID=A0A0L7QTZ5_9HYME|nr:PREDICTED: interferon-inducible double-stranded RNA-dependent protein kinase activator A-like [Habropoda laboriosa]KOC62095.1 Interferon-inducible double stranded RNA-dependent protein kinase activator A [Habropoda laboriosa]
MSKTPVSILQEMMVKEHIVPKYELVHDGGGTHMNTFIYRVTCGSMYANGTGRSKKDAKHEAAKALLEIIVANRNYPQLPASPAQSPVRTPLPATVPEVERIPPNVPFVNAVGVLQTLCVENDLEEPKYELISDVGPPHAKVFTIQCKVATFQEVGIGKTKKQAKKEAAKKLLDKLTDIIPDLNEMQSETEPIMLDSGNEYLEVIKKYTAIKKVKLGVKLSEYHTEMRTNINDEKRKDLIEKLTSLVQESYTISEECVKDLSDKFENILSIIDSSMSIVLLQSISSNIYSVAVKLNSTPDIVEIAVGDSKTGATFHALMKIINTMLQLLK